ncbi:MAG: SpoIIE family protein phosphatase [Leptospiraceae bacterium]|nr:SpoIIE family protein phosphatase [Leptospiraceae bacterium]MCP5497362.1 SpoIIE family protein phosphatase [Leptospiraceae bacterium]
MEIFDYFYFNYFVLGSFISFLSWTVCGGFLLYIKKKSNGTIFLGLSLLTGSVISLGYMFSQGFFSPVKFPRFLTLVFIPIHHLLLVQFLFHFPNVFKPQIAKIVFYIQSWIALVMIAFLFWSIYNASAYYNFKAHYYDFNMPTFTSFYTVLSFVYALFLYIVGIWKIFFVSNYEKKTLVYLLVGLFFCSILPAITNILNKIGMVDRATYINVFCTFCAVGLFIILMVYANKTKDRSNFMFKVVGVSFLILMTIYNLVSYIVLDHIEEVYDKTHQESSKLPLDNKHHTQDLCYVIESELSGENQRVQIDLVKNNIDTKNFVADGSRIYRESYRGNDKYIAYGYTDILENRTYEYGFSYLGYKKFVHTITLKLLYVLLIAVVFVSIGTPIFLSRAIAEPLKTLLNGIRKVREGKLDVNLPIKIHDEIGYLTGVFNSMVHSIDMSKKKLEEYSNHLEDMVSTRTKELQKSLKEIQDLKEKQDGDYFLTTLLLNPLIKNNASSDRVRIDFLVKQNKEFFFREKIYDIGGDICISENIELRGKRYTVFLNADAMGKSIQGAGGVLVIGSVFQSIIQRTMTYEYHFNLYPEKWIKNAFKDMHKVFESFDCSMLISTIFGLLDEDNGQVYYINAEHPWIILYRDNIASFLEDKVNIRKLGTPGLEGELYVSTFLLKQGDILIMGSDGKDDVIFENAFGEKVINEDELFILSRVMESKGNIERIYESISKSFELKDDISLLSIQYYGDRNDAILDDDLAIAIIKSAEKSYQDGFLHECVKLLTDNYKKHQAISRYLIELYVGLRKFGEATKIAHEYLSHHGVDSNLLYKVAFSMKMNNEIEEAIEISERVRLREPWNIQNLLFLIEMYISQNNYTRAKKLLQKALNIEPNNAKAKRLWNQIRDK